MPPAITDKGQVNLFQRGLRRLAFENGLLKNLFQRRIKGVIIGVAR